MSKHIKNFIGNETVDETLNDIKCKLMSDLKDLYSSTNNVKNFSP